MVFLVYSLLDQLWVINKTLGVALWDELHLVACRLFESQLSWASIHQ
jgi:hypothetical protein